MRENKQVEIRMWPGGGQAPVGAFLGWLLLIWGAVTAVLLLLEPYAVSFAQGGPLTAEYVVYALVGVLLDTPSPMIAIYIVLRRRGRIASVREFCGLIFHTPRVGYAVGVTAAFCAAALCAALLFGTPTGAPWYLFLLALPAMVIGGGVEEVGWRGFLQPALERRFPFPIATFLVAVIRYVWHLSLWLQPSSNHYGDSLIGFAITILVWAFAAAAIYKTAQSVFACVMYHAFLNAIGAVFDWNALFDAFPGQAGMAAYRCVILASAVALWIVADKQGGGTGKQETLATKGLS